MKYVLFIWLQQEIRIVGVYEDNSQAVKDGRTILDAKKCDRFNVVEVPYYPTPNTPTNE